MEGEIVGRKGQRMEGVKGNQGEKGGKKMNKRENGSGGLVIDSTTMFKTCGRKTNECVLSGTCCMH